MRLSCFAPLQLFFFFFKPLLNFSLFQPPSPLTESLPLDSHSSFFDPILWHLDFALYCNYYCVYFIFTTRLKLLEDGNTDFSFPHRCLAQKVTIWIDVCHEPPNLTYFVLSTKGNRIKVWGQKSSSLLEGINKTRPRLASLDGPVTESLQAKLDVLELRTVAASKGFGFG